MQTYSLYRLYDIIVHHRHIILYCQRLCSYSCLVAVLQIRIRERDGTDTPRVRYLSMAQLRMIPQNIIQSIPLLALIKVEALRALL